MDESASIDDIDQRILKAAEAAFIHYGFDKTTLNDIAQAAGIARSTLYSRWKKKDALFATLIARELSAFVDNWLARVEDDPQGGTFAGIFKNALLSIYDSPLIEALYKNDRQLMGSFVHRMAAGDFYAQRLALNRSFLEQLQQAGIVRADLDILGFAYIANCLHYGVLCMSDMISDDYAPPMTQILASLAETVERMVTPPDPGDSEAGKQIIREYVAIARQEIDKFNRRLGRHQHGE